MHATDFPANMPRVWECLWGHLRKGGPAVVLGEWGGLIDNGDHGSSTAVWQVNVRADGSG
jgi:hypothetical protein